MVERNRQSQRSHGVMSHRSSQRSHGTSSSSSHETRFACKDCCRKFVTFMCTQVGVGGLVVSYAIMGSFAFMSIEGNTEPKINNATSDAHEEAVKRMWDYTLELNTLHKDIWYSKVNTTLFDFQESIVEAYKKGYEGKEVQNVWTFSASLMFCLSVFSMIGYGHMTPKTVPGKISTILYAMLGIPLYIVYFMNMGKVFAKFFKFLYRSLYRCLNKEKMESTHLENGLWQHQIIIVPSTACIWVMVLYIMLGTIMFALWENWSYLDACYFSFTSLAKIGIGDFVPGIGGASGQTDDSHTKLIINFMYLLVGMALIAMCYTLMKEEIMLKVHALEHDFKEKLYYIGLRIGLYTEEQPQQVNLKQRTKSTRKTVRRRLN